MVNAVPIDQRVWSGRRRSNVGGPRDRDLPTPRRRGSILAWRTSSPTRLRASTISPFGSNSPTCSRSGTGSSNESTPCRYLRRIGASLLVAWPSTVPLLTTCVLGPRLRTTFGRSSRVVASGDRRLDGTARNAFGVNPYGMASEPFRCALVTARLIGPEARALIPLIADAFRRGLGTSACEALLALTAIAPTDDETAAILAGALARDPELASTAAGEIIRLKLVDHPVIRGTLAGSETARAALDWASGAKPV